MMKVLKRSLTNFISFNSSEVLNKLSKFFYYIQLLTFYFYNIKFIFNKRTFNSLNLAFTLISSGGFLPTNDLSNIIKENSQILFSFLMLISFFSIFFSYNLVFFKKKI